MNTASVRGDKAIKLVAFSKIATNQALAKEPRHFSKRLDHGEPLPKAWEKHAAVSPQHLTRIRGDVVSLLRMDIKPVKLAAYLDAAGAQSSNSRLATSSSSEEMI